MTTPDFSAIVQQTENQIVKRDRESKQRVLTTVRENQLTDFRDKVRQVASPLVDHTYSNVADEYLAENSIPWDDMLDIVSNTESNHSDNFCRVQDVSAKYESGKLLLSDGRHELLCQPGVRTQLWSRLGLPTDFHNLWQDAADEQGMNWIIENRLRLWKDNNIRASERVGKGRKASTDVFLRTHDIGGGEHVCRALLSSGFHSIPHSFIIRCLIQILGERGTVTHFNREKFVESLGKYMRFNVLLPDSVRKIGDDDSEFGTMLSCENHETGGGAYRIKSALFRCVCSNGLILGQEAIKDIRQRHNGEIDLGELANDINDLCLQSFSVNGQTIDDVVTTLSSRVSSADVPIEAVAAHAMRNITAGPSVAERKGIYGAMYYDSALPSAMAIVNGITRFAGSKLVADDRRYDLEVMAGQLANDWTDETIWENAVGNAEVMMRKTTNRGQQRKTLFEDELSRVLTASLAS